MYAQGRQIKLSWVICYELSWTKITEQRGLLRFHADMKSNFLKRFINLIVCKGNLYYPLLFFFFFFSYPEAFYVAQLVKNLPAMRETQVWSLGWEDPLEKGMATHSSLPAWRIQWTEEPGGLQSMGFQRIIQDWTTNTHTHTHTHTHIIKLLPHSLSQMVMCVRVEKVKDLLSWQMSNIQYSIINYSYHAVH